MANVVFDSTYLIDLFNINLLKEKRGAIDSLVARLRKSGTRILVPAPCFTELLINADAARDEYADRLSREKSFEIIPFDQRAAMECALLLSEFWDKPSRKSVSRTKFKYDWMVVACAASRNVDTIYSDDSDIARCASDRGIQVIKQSQLPKPAEQPQLPLDYAPASDPPAG